MTSVANHLSSYEVGKSPFRPDVNRGKWNSKYEFYLACIGHAFGAYTFTTLASFAFTNGGVLHVLILSLSVIFFLIPIYLIQSAMGQFSSTGCITVFRLSPLFKGLGYITTFLNLFSSSYFSITAAYSLLYLYSSVNYELPWLSCNHTWNSLNCSEVLNITIIDLYHEDQSSASEFYMELTQFGGRGSPFSWHIFFALIVVWIFVCLFVVKGVQMLGKVFWYTTLIPISILVVFLIRSFFTAGIGEALSQIFSVTDLSYNQAFASPLVAVMLLGPGWNTILTLASYNDFKTDVEKAAFIIPSIMLGLSFVAGTIVMAAIEHIRAHVENATKLYFVDDEMHFHFIMFTHFLGHLEAPHMWSLLYFLMLLLLEFNSVAILVLTVLTAIYDEYDKLRPYKTYINIGVCILCCCASTLYSFGNSLVTFTLLAVSSYAMKGLVWLLELMIYVWVYGRVRFLRDITFLLGRSFASWKFYIIRFVTPILALFGVLFGMVFTYMYVMDNRFVIIFNVKLTLLLFIPGYMIYRLSTTTGPLSTRLRKCLKPTDWYPVEFEHRNAYEAMVGTSDTSHQLVTTESFNEVENGAPH